MGVIGLDGKHDGLAYDHSPVLEGRDESAGGGVEL